MRTVRTKIYKFVELTSDSQQKVISRFRYINIDGHEWHTPIYDRFKIILEERGFEISEIGHSVCHENWCIEAVHLIGQITDFSKFIRKVDRRVVRLIMANKIPIVCTLDNYRVNFKIDRWIPKSEMFGAEYTTNIEKELKQLEENINIAYATVCHEIFLALQGEYEYLTDSDMVIQTIEANKYEFFYNGNLVNHA